MTAPSNEKDVPPRNPEQDCAACGWRSRAAAPALCPACGKPMPDAAIPPGVATDGGPS